MTYKIYNQSVFTKWPLPDKSCQSIITSPPYWNLRHYDIPDIVIGGNRDCKHIFTTEEYIRNNDKTAGKKQKTNLGSVGRDEPIRHGYCLCGAWKGQYGLEPSYKGYIEHTVLWAKEAWRVLSDDGVFFLNIGDTYGTVSGSMGSSKYNDLKLSIDANNAQPNKFNINMHKCKLLIPHRIAINMIDLGWILRNDIIWQKNNAMPESINDRFSKKYENIFMFVKRKNYYFNLDAVKEPTITKDGILRDRDTTKLNNTPGRTKMGGLKENNYDFKNPGDVWGINTQPSKFKHYAMWPQKLVERMILCSTKEGDIVLDPFAGSGTTLKLAVKNNREAIGIDLGYKDIQEENLKNIQTTLF